MTASPALQLLPAVDVAGGRAVRLVGAREGSAADHGDPLAVALSWQAAGAAWVHLVDIDAAFGRGSNHPLLRQIVEALEVDVQLSGGIRDEESLRSALATGCTRVNLSTAALADLDWVVDAIRRYGPRIAVGLDVLAGRLVARGSGADVGEPHAAVTALDSAGCARYIVTDVTRDGALSGPNVALLRTICSLTTRPVVASGGIGSLADIVVLRALLPDGVEGAILGQALYTGAFTLTAALTIAGHHSAESGTTVGPGPAAHLS